MSKKTTRNIKKTFDESRLLQAHYEFMKNKLQILNEKVKNGTISYCEKILDLPVLKEQVNRIFNKIKKDV